MAAHLLTVAQQLCGCLDPTTASVLCCCYNRISELRAVELLEGICDQMKNYIYATFTITASGNTTQQWDKWMGKDATAMINSTRWVTAAGRGPGGCAATAGRGPGGGSAAAGRGTGGGGRLSGGG